MRHTGVSLYVHGAPGISKSAVARQVADGLNIAFIDIRLSQMAPEDVRGVPMLGEQFGMKGVIWSPPLVFPRDLDLEQTQQVQGVQTIRFFNPVGNNDIHYCTKPKVSVEALDDGLIAEVLDVKPDRFTVSMRDAAGCLTRGFVEWQVTGKSDAIFALEEFNSAPPSVMAAAYQLILDRRLGDYVVPDGVMLLAMGNRDNDKGVTFKIPKPVANRFVHIEMEVNFEDWLQWAVENMIHPDVVGYLSKWNSKLHDFQPDSPSHSFASPRSWEFASKIISLPDVPGAVMRSLVCGAIGDAIGNEFLLHRQFMQDMPDVADILSGKITAFKPQNPQYATQISYSVCTQLMYLLKIRSDTIKQKYRGDKEAEKLSPELQQWRIEADRAIGYILDNFQPEVAIMSQRIGMGTYRLRFSGAMPRLADFIKVYGDMMMGV